MPMPEAEIAVDHTYEGHGWRTPRKVVDIVTEPGRWGGTYVLYESVETKPRRGKKYLCAFAFEATSRKAERPTGPMAPAD